MIRSLALIALHFPVRVRMVLLGALSVLALSGCAGTGKQCVPAQPAPGGAAVLVVYFPDRAIGNYYTRAYEPPISIDDCIVGTLNYRSFLRYDVAPGARKIRAERWGGADFEIPEITRELRAGQTTFVRFSMRRGTLRAAIAGGLYSVLGSFAVLEKDDALKEMPALSGVAN
jgi:hypothetical protein